jgi:hypothetical protein
VKAAIVLAGLCGVAHADDDARPWHGSVGAGGAFVLTGAQDGARQRGDVLVDVKPGSRYGILLGWRGFTGNRTGLVTGGLVFEGAAARPRLVVDLHVDAGADLDQHAPLVGAGIRTTLTIIGPLAVGFDTSAVLVLDDIDTSRVQLQTSALAVVRW